jgi:regulator of sigma E protease
VDSTTTSVTVIRDNDTLKLAITPEIIDKKSKRLQIGVGPNTDSAYDEQHKKYSFIQSISRGNSMGLDKLQGYIGQFKYLFTKKGAGEIGGFISIGKIFPSKWSWQSFWSITAFLSIMLGFMNLLPIPALDGGHALFVLFEMITGRKPSDKFLEYAQITGFVLLMGLLLLANGNDIYKLIKGWL